MKTSNFLIKGFFFSIIFAGILVFLFNNINILIILISILVGFLSSLILEFTNSVIRNGKKLNSAIKDADARLSNLEKFVEKQKSEEYGDQGSSYLDMERDLDNAYETRD